MLGCNRRIKLPTCRRKMKIIRGQVLKSHASKKKKSFKITGNNKYSKINWKDQKKKQNLLLHIFGWKKEEKWKVAIYVEKLTCFSQTLVRK